MYFFFSSFVFFLVLHAITNGWMDDSRTRKKRRKKRRRIGRLRVCIQLNLWTHHYHVVSLNLLARRSYGVFFTLDLDLLSAGVRLRLHFFLLSVLLFGFCFAKNIHFRTHREKKRNKSKTHETRERE